MRLEGLRQMVRISLMAALTAVGAQMAVPLGPVPMVLTTLFVLLAGLLLGPKEGLLAMALYLVLGAMGLPVFAHFKGGLAHFLGPTGGYLFAFPLAAGVTGYLSRLNRGKTADVIAVLAGSLLIYGLGVPWLKWVAGMSWIKALSVGMFPFLIGDAVKASAALWIAWSLRPLIRRHWESLPA